MFSEKKDTLYFAELLSSVTWFFMDSFWMFDLKWMSLILSCFCFYYMILTIIFCEKEFTSIMINVSALFWFLMNFFWMFSEELNTMVWAKSFFIIGLISIILTIYKSDKSKHELFLKFRKFKIK